MSLSDWSALAEIVSAIGVVISLGFVGIQVRRNTRQLQFQAIETSRKEFLNTIDAKGLLPTQDFVLMRALLVSLLKTPGGQQWWNTFKHVPPPYLVAELQAAIDDQSSAITSATEALPWLRIGAG